MKPKIYLRYVDDIFVVFPKDVDHTPFFDELNNQHQNLRFTVEVGGNHLAFLDTQISINNSDFETWVYRKPTNTNVILNYSAICPIQWKIGLLKCLLNRAWVLCSNYHRLHEDIEKLKSKFKSNGYPVAFFNRIVKQFLDQKFLPKLSRTSSNSLIPDGFSDVTPKRYVLKVPFVGKPSLLFKRKITNLVKETYDDINFSCVFESFKVKNYFSLKCKSNPFLAANVVYKFSCRSDPNTFYISETKRQLGIRASEHLDLDNSNSSIRNYIQ